MNVEGTARGHVCQVEKGDKKENEMTEGVVWEKRCTVQYPQKGGGQGGKGEIQNAGRWVIGKGVKGRGA